jgi:hypothetical protein
MYSIASTLLSTRIPVINVSKLYVLGLIFFFIAEMTWPQI